jgi:hypothetical protein
VIGISAEQALNYRLMVNNLSARLPAGFYAQAAFAGLQDTAPRDALLGLHARVQACEPDAGEDPSLTQTDSPRRAVYVLPKEDFGVFTVGRLPRDAEARQAVEDEAEQVCRSLAGQPGRGAGLAGSRAGCATGRIVLRWTASSLELWEQPRPAIDPEAARLELCRRHVRAFGPTTPAAFAWWAGVSARDARTTFAALAAELVPVDLAGHPAWILAADMANLTSAEPMRGVRLLVASDLRLFGQDRTGLFAGPGKNDHCRLQDWFHPNGLVVAGRIVGAWGRRGGKVDIRACGSLAPAVRREICAEAESMPIPGAEVTVVLTGS